MGNSIPDRSASKPTGWDQVAWGFAIAVGCSFVAIAVQFALVQHWYATLQTRPDFEGNGLQWLFLGLVFIVPIFVAVTFVLIFAVVLPAIYAVRRRNARPGPNPFAVTATAEVLIAIACVLLIGWGGTHEVLAMVSLPMLLTAGPAIYFFMKKMNANLV